MAIKLTDKEIDLVRYIGQFRYCTIAHLILVTGRKRESLLRTIKKLKKKHLILQNDYGGQVQSLYWLNKAGYEFVIKKGFLKEEDKPKNIKYTRSQLFRDHDVAISDVHTAFLLESRTNPIKLSRWQQGSPIETKIRAYTGSEYKTFPVHPDAFFAVRLSHIPEDSNRLAFALEVDLDTMSKARMIKKFNGYRYFLDEKKHKDFFKVRWFQIITVTDDKTRSNYLLKLTKKILPPRLYKHFYFGSLEEISLNKTSSLYEPIFRTPKSEDYLSFIPDTYL